MNAATINYEKLFRRRRRRSPLMPRAMVRTVATAASRMGNHIAARLHLTCCCITGQGKQVSGPGRVLAEWSCSSCCYMKYSTAGNFVQNLTTEQRLVKRKCSEYTVPGTIQTWHDSLFSVFVEYLHEKFVWSARMFAIIWLEFDSYTGCILCFHTV